MRDGNRVRQRNKILIDAGSNLPSPEHEGKPELPIEKISEGAKGVFVTHYHGDHIGLFENIPGGIPVYIGKAAKEIYATVGKYIKKDMDKIGDIVPYEVRDRLKAGDITVTPYRVDHTVDKQ